MNHRARKRFGQNFLHDQQVILRIINAIAAGSDHHLAEIGPGMGALTEELAYSSGSLDLIELDRDLIANLQKKFSQPHVRIHNTDALAFDFSSLVSAPEKLRVVGNLPYNISTPLIFHLLDQHEHIQDMHFMLQKEVVERLCAQPGSKQYGRLSIMAGYLCQCTSLFDVPPESFDPAPKVMSAVVRITPRPFHLQANSRQALEKVVTKAFTQRRKTIRNGLKGMLEVPELEALGIDPAARAETLPLENWIALANRYQEIGGGD